MVTFRLSKRGVSNILLMLGVVLCMAIMLIGGWMLIAGYLEYKATSSSQFIATDVTLLIGSLHAAPESALYEYYTGMDEDGYPVIGSLEIDDDKRELCIHPHSEGEIYSVISTRVGEATGFGIAAYSVYKMRRYLAKRAKIAAMSNKQKVDKIFEFQESRTYKSMKGRHFTNEYIDQRKTAANLLADDGKQGNAIRKGMLSKGGDQSAKARFFKPGADDAEWILRKAQQENGDEVLEQLFKHSDDPIEFALVAEKHGFKDGPEDMRKLRQTSKWLSKGGGKEIGEELTTSGETRKVFAKQLSQKGTRDALSEVDDLSKVPRMRYILKSMQASWPARKWKQLTRWASRTRLGQKVGIFAKVVRGKFSIIGGKIRGVFSVIGQKTGITKAVGWIARKAKAGVAAIKAVGGAIKTRIANSAIAKGAKSFAKSASQWWSRRGIKVVESKFMRKFLDRFIMKRVTKQLAAKGTLTTTQAASQQIEAPTCATVAGCPASVATHLANVAIGMLDAIHTMIVTDFFLWRIDQAGKSAAKREKKLKTCKEYVDVGDKVLLYPPNCVPYLKYGEKENTQEVRDKIKKKDFHKELDNRISAVGKAGVSIIDKIKNFDPLGAIGGILDFFWQIYRVAEFIIGHLINSISEFVKSVDSIEKVLAQIFPHADCYEDSNVRHYDVQSNWDVKSTGCDQENLGQDCPNYFVSDPGDWPTKIAPGFVIVLMQLGPVCALWSAGGFTSPACNIVRYMGAFGVFMLRPGDILNFFQHNADIGFKKKVGTKKFGEPCPDGKVCCNPSKEVCYANNKWYWYAEFPGSIQIVKTYLPGTGEQRVVISKG